MLVKTRIEQRLTEALTPIELVVTDQSEQHRGHAGARSEGETHFDVKIVSAAFLGKTRVARQRMVYAILAEELGNSVHALSLLTLTPEENGRKPPLV